jgi:hypothetical protein
MAITNTHHEENMRSFSIGTPVGQQGFEVTTSSSNDIVGCGGIIAHATAVPAV